MEAQKPVAIVGVGSILPDASNAQSFWENIKKSHYSINDVPSNRWSTDLYFDTNLASIDKTYTKIGAWVRDFAFEPLKWGIPIPPNVAASMDDAQKWGVAASRLALLDYGYPQRKLEPDRVAVILGNAMGGEYHYRSTMRIRLPEYLNTLANLPIFKDLPPSTQSELLQQMQAKVWAESPSITEDTMPGELSNIIAGRIANVFNFSGPNFVTDAACASSLAAINSAIEGLNNHQFDVVLTGGVDRSMGPESFIKFCKIGALSPDGSRPYSDGANGFVMGEGAIVFLVKRLADAEKDGDKIYAVIRGVGGSSDGKGKGITAPNPAGQQKAIERAWRNAGISPATVGLIEGHGTSTKVGDVAEVNSLATVYAPFGLPVHHIALGSVKSNIGHLKSAAGAAGVLKTAFALRDGILPPSANFTRPNPNIDFAHIPFYVNTHTQTWEKNPGEIRRAGVSSFGFGGTNFHVVMEEHIPGLLTDGRMFQGVEIPKPAVPSHVESITSHQVNHEATSLPTYRGLFFAGAANTEKLKENILSTLDDARNGSLPAQVTPPSSAVAQPERIAVDYSDATDLIKKLEKALKAFENDTPSTRQALTAQAVYRGSGLPGKVAFTFPGQGSQYPNMLKDLGQVEPVIADTFREADEVMAPILGKKLTDFIYVNNDEASLAKAEIELKNTTITQPAVLTTNVAILRLMHKFGFSPELVIGHSLGEYAALVAAGVLSFSDALKVVSARGQAMVKVASVDNGCMAAVSAPLSEVERILQTIQEYVVLANINSPLQSVLGGSTAGIDAALAAFQAAGFQAVKIPVSHAFHTKIVGAASQPLRAVLEKMSINPPQIPVIANVTGSLYPQNREEILDILAQQVASPVQFVKGMQTLYDNGARIFLESGPKRVITALATDNLKGHEDVNIIATNHPRKGDLPSFNEALCGLYAAGVVPTYPETASKPIEINSNTNNTNPSEVTATKAQNPNFTGSVVISGAGLGLPGVNNTVFSEDNIQRILKGEYLIEPLPVSARRSMLEKRVTRLEKSESGATMVTIDDIDQTIKLAGQRGTFDLVNEFGVPVERVETYDITTQLAIAAGIEALRDAGIPLTMRYRQTSKGTLLPDRWMLPPALADETGVIFASAFPGLNNLAEEVERFRDYEHLIWQLDELKKIDNQSSNCDPNVKSYLAERISFVEKELAEVDYHFDRRFIFKILTMGHSQFAEYIGARGPNTHVNAACASTTHAVAIAEDWIRAGRCRRVVIIAGDDVSSGSLVGWIGTGLFASGASTTEGDVRKAAIPFDRRRNGMIMGMGAAALVVESQDSLQERGMVGICELLSTQIANSAFHGTRLDIAHVSSVMERLLQQAESRFSIDRGTIAEHMVFVSHETYTPARGGSAAAEIHALRKTFKQNANKVIIANTKGYTGHTMGVGIEDVVAVKALEFGLVPPIAHFDDEFEPDPDLGDLNLSHGGSYNIEYALRLGAGFGSQIAMTLTRRIPAFNGRKVEGTYQNWIKTISGYSSPELEVVQHTLRIRHSGVPQITPSESIWDFGQPPVGFSNQPVVVQAEVKKADATPEQLGSRPQAPNPIQQAPIISAPARSDIQQFILSVVSEKTGYPTEMLDLDLDLEADLGIDTVKQAELFLTIRTHFNIPRRDDLRLSDYNTLAKVMQFMVDAMPASAPVYSSAHVTPPTPKAPESAPTSEEVVIESKSSSIVDEADVKQFILGVVSQKTGYPVEMLDLDLDMEADLGIDTVKQAELFLTIRTHYNIPRREDLRLSDYNTLDKVMKFMLEALQMQSPPVLVSQSTPLKEQASTIVDEEQIAATEGDTEVKTYVLTVVSEKTGYPQEMLDLDLDLEADLGIDTVKQAELFATVRSHFGIPRRENLRLADYNTLKKVIGFILDALEEQKSIELTSKTGEVGTPVNQTGSEKSGEPSINASITRRIPVLALRPRLDLCQPTGVQLTSTSRVLIISSNGKYADSLARRLRARKVQVEKLVLSSSQSFDQVLKQSLKDGAFQGVYNLVGLDPVDFFSLDQQTWAEKRDQMVYTLFHLMKTLPGDPFLITATKSGLLDKEGPQTSNAFSGALRGFSKALAREKHGSLVKVIDFTSEPEESTVADHLIRETIYDPAVAEVFWKDDQRYCYTLVDKPFSSQNVAQPSFQKDAVYVISGGTGGITIPIIEDLASRTTGKFYILGRSALDENDPDINKIKLEKSALKKELAERLSTPEKKATPAQIEQVLATLERSAAAIDAFKRMRAQGSTVQYLICDVTDFPSVQKAVADIQATEGKVDVLIHAAGVEKSHRLESKSFTEFQTVFSTKADGFFNLFHAFEVNGSLPSTILSFGSIAGRFGNAGQTDYSAANDQLCALSTLIKRKYPQCTVKVFDWGAWSDVGMASRGSLPELMKRAGIEMIAPSTGAPLVFQELTYSSADVEIVFAGALGRLDENHHEHDGVDLVKANVALTKGKPSHVMLSRLVDYRSDKGITLETSLDPATEPFLKDHAMNGIPLLPGVMGIEGFITAAQHIANALGGEKSRFVASHLNNVQFLAPLKFYRNEARQFTWNAQVYRDQEGLVANVTLHSIQKLMNREPERILHFTGQVHLVWESEQKTKQKTDAPIWNNEAPTIHSGDIYRLFFHGPSFQVLESAQKYRGGILGKLKTNLPSLVRDGHASPLTPVLTELCLQTAGIWSIGSSGSLSLPSSINQLHLYSLKELTVPVYAWVQQSEDQTSYSAQVIDAVGNVYMEFEGYKTSPLPYTYEERLMEPLKQVINGNA